MSAGTARRRLGSGVDFHAALTVADRLDSPDGVTEILDALGLLKPTGDLGTVLDVDNPPPAEPSPEPALARPGAKPLPLALVHTHSDACAMWPPHRGRGPDAKPLDELLRERVRPVPEQRDASDPVEKEEAAPESTPVHALATSAAARDQHADARLDDHLAVTVLASNPAAGATLHVTGPVDDVERLVQRVQQYRPTDPESSPQRPASRPLTVRCTLCRRPVRHDPGQAAAALTAHYTDQHPGGQA